MQHLDDAQIAAYLDGETAPEPIDRHLAECATCRSRLDAERAVHARAATILDEAGPGAIETPSFDEVLIRAGRKSAARHPRLSFRALAWAATIALAFGAGWMLRRPGVVREASGPPTVPGMIARAPERAAPPPEAAAAKQAPPSSPTAAPPRGAPRGKAAEATGAAAAAPTPAEGAPKNALQAKPSQPLATITIAPSTDTGRPTPPALGKQPPVGRAEASLAQQGEVNAAREVVAPSAATIQADALELKKGSWLPVRTKLEAAGRLGAAVAVVHGLDARYAVSQGAPVFVRVEQPLGGGAVLTLIEHRVQVDTTVTTAPTRVPADSGFAAMELVREGTRIRASAPISGDSLLALLRRLD